MLPLISRPRPHPDFFPPSPLPLRFSTTMTRDNSFAGPRVKTYGFEFPSQVVAQLEAYRQRDDFYVESGGLLAGSLHSTKTGYLSVITDVTTPQRGDIQGRSEFVRSGDHIHALTPALRASTQFFGEWHTHATDNGASRSDLRSLLEYRGRSITILPIVVLILTPRRSLLYVLDPANPNNPILELAPLKAR